MSETNTNTTVDPLGKKCDVAAMLNCAPRTVDNYLVQGCPHYKPSPRSVRFDMAEVKAWYKAKYSHQKRKSLDDQTSFTE